MASHRSGHLGQPQLPDPTGPWPHPSFSALGWPAASLSHSGSQEDNHRKKTTTSLPQVAVPAQGRVKPGRCLQSSKAGLSLQQQEDAAAEMLGRMARTWHVP